VLAEQALHPIEADARQLVLRVGGRELGAFLARVEDGQHSPSRTDCPEENPMRSTMPGRSALTVTPRTGATEPMAPSTAGHFSSLATIVVTASGGHLEGGPLCDRRLDLREFHETEGRDDGDRRGQHDEHSLEHISLTDRP
jgi:hypothetical protein